MLGQRTVVWLAASELTNKKNKGPQWQEPNTPKTGDVFELVLTFLKHKGAERWNIEAFMEAQEAPGWLLVWTGGFVFSLPVSQRD